MLSKWHLATQRSTGYAAALSELMIREHPARWSTCHRRDDHLFRTSQQWYTHTNAHTPVGPEIPVCQGCSPIQNFTTTITHTHIHTHNPCWSRDPCQGCSPIQNFTITITNNTQHTHTHTCWSRDPCLGILLISELSPCCTISSAWIPRFQICILLPRCDLAYLASWRPLCHFIFSKCQYFIVGLLIPNSVPSCSPCPAPVQF